MKSLLLLLLLALPGPVARLCAQTEHAVLPNVADPASGSPNNAHFAYVNPAVAPLGKLLVFFPGTGGAPVHYRLFVKHAANLGYHAVGLTYQNAVAINALCSNVADTTCHRRARLEVFDGTDRHPDLAVDSVNCIRRRLLRLLQHLHASYPAENWGQYYAGNTLLWSRFVLAGHSQGGGYAGIIAKLHAVDRVVLLAAADWVTPLNRPADWLTWPGATPAASHYGFIHRQDEEVPFPLEQVIWAKLGLNAWGNAVLTDGASAPYQNSHRLYTQLTPALDPGKFHGSIATDAYTPLTGTTPTLQPVWTYLLTATATSLAGTAPIAPPLLPYPNPARDVLHVPAASGSTYQLLDLQGRVAQQGPLVANELRLAATLAPGCYLLRLHAPDGTLTGTARVSCR